MSGFPLIWPVRGSAGVEMAESTQDESRPNNDNADETSSMPRDARAIAAILKDNGITSYEPRVVNHLLEFVYRYVTDVLDDAKLYSNHAGNSVITKEDVKLAIQAKLDHSFTSPPPRDFLIDLARQKNNTTLPTLKSYTGARLPPDRYCLTSVNYRLKDHETGQKKPYWQSTSDSTGFRHPGSAQSSSAVKRKWEDD